MDLNELFKDVTSFNKEAAMKENMRMVELKDNVTANAFRDAQIKLASYVNVIKIDSPESNLTEFSRNKLSGKMKAMLSVSTTAGLKRLPIHFVVKASVPTMVETPEQVVAALDNVEGSIDKEVKEILEKQKQMAAYHNEDIEVKAEDKKFHIHLPGSFYTQEIYGKTIEEALENYGYKMEDIVEWYDDEGNGEYVKKDSSANSNITVQAKKKEIDLGVRENSSASQFPVKLLVYPKTYLPELKKGDILNVGGFKYRYIGDEPTISGDTENGINARFELVVSTKKASLEVKADKLPETTQEDINQAKREAKEMKEYLEGLAKEDLSDKDEEDIQLDVLNLLDYGQPIPPNYFKAIGNNRNLSLWFLSLDKTPITDLEGDVPANIFKHISNDAKAAYKVLTDHPTDTFTSFDKLPQFFQDVFMTDTSIMVKIAEEHPEWVSEKMADEIIENSPSEAIELGVSGEGRNVKNPVFDKFKAYADEQGIKSESPTNEEIGVEDGPAEGEHIDEDDMDFTGAEDEENEYRKQQKDYGADLSGTGLENVIKEKQEEAEDEANQNQDITDDEEHEKKEPKKKSENVPDIEKEADVSDDLTFEEDVRKMYDDGRLEFQGNLIAKVKEKYEQIKNIPDEWIEVSTEQWDGKIKWAIDLDARSWGLSNFAIRCYPTKLSCDVELSYYANAEAADKDDSTEDTFTVEFDLAELEPEFNNALESGSQLFATSLVIDADGTSATVGF